MKIGDKIKNLRIQKNISQKDFAKQLDIPVSTLANYENNHREPKLDTLSKIATSLNISLADLLDKNQTLTNKLIDLFDKTVCKYCDAENTLELICELIDIDLDVLNDSIKNNKELSESYLINIINKIYLEYPKELLEFYVINKNLLNDYLSINSFLKNILNIDKLITPRDELEEALINSSPNISELVDKVNKSIKEDSVKYFRKLIYILEWNRFKNESDDDIYSVINSVELYAYLQGLFDMQKKEKE